MSDRQRVALYAEFTARAGAEGAVATLIGDLARHVRSLDGTLLFEVWRLADRPRHFVVFEVYADQAAFDRQLDSEQNRHFNAGIGDLIEEPETRLTWLSDGLE